MCRLCDEETKDDERKRMKRISEKLSILSYGYDCLSRGTLLPHTTEMKNLEPTVKTIIRELVEEWV